MTNRNIHLNSPLRVSESFMFSHISSWLCPLRWQRNDRWKNTTTHTLMKALRIIYHSHPNYTVWLFQVILRKTNGEWNVVGCPCWPCPWEHLAVLPSETWSRPPLLAPRTSSINCDFSCHSTDFSISLSSVSNTSFTQCFCFLISASKNKHIHYIVLRLSSSLQLSFSQLMWGLRTP